MGEEKKGLEQQLSGIGADKLEIEARNAALSSKLEIAEARVQQLES